MSTWEVVTELGRLLPDTARGPRRESTYALWLLARVAQDFLLEPPLPDRPSRRRLAALESRLSSLTLTPPLRRGLAAALLILREGRPDQLPVLFSTLVAPARDGVGPEVAEAIARAAKGARAVMANTRRPT